MSGDPSIFVLQANENWVTDVYVSDFLQGTALPIVKSPEEADIVWLLASWCWNHIRPETLARKMVICTVHHIVPEKFDAASFLARDQFVNVYFVYTHETANIIRQHTNKPIARVAHWIDSARWPITPRGEARKRVGLTDDEFVVGSFQRDTEGSDLVSPKLEKGPDILCDLLERMSAEGHSSARWLEARVRPEQDKGTGHQGAVSHDAATGDDQGHVRLLRRVSLHVSPRGRSNVHPRVRDHARPHHVDARGNGSRCPAPDAGLRPVQVGLHPAQRGGNQLLLRASTGEVSRRLDPCLRRNFSSDLLLLRREGTVSVFYFNRLPVLGPWGGGNKTLTALA